jgi:hypothetical protein
MISIGWVGLFGTAAMGMFMMIFFQVMWILLLARNGFRLGDTLIRFSEATLRGLPHIAQNKFLHQFPRS